jgi:hypothetical protein
MMAFFLIKIFYDKGTPNYRADIDEIGEMMSFSWSYDH